MVRVSMLYGTAAPWDGRVQIPSPLLKSPHPKLKWGSSPHSLWRMEAREPAPYTISMDLGLPILESSTTSLQRMQNTSMASSHVALHKWGTQLGSPLPKHIWQDTWLPYRSAKENTFLSQIAYGAIATLGWRFPYLPHSDLALVHCPRCNLNLQEDVVHCLWQCPVSATCWRWCDSLLARAAQRQLAVIQLQSPHVLVPVLPDHWNVPARLWHIVRAAMCWILWKDRNNCLFTARSSDLDVVIHRTWHRIGTYIRLEWQKFLCNV